MAKFKPELFNKQPYYLSGCDIYEHLAANTKARKKGLLIMNVTSSALQLRLEQLTTIEPDERQALSELEQNTRSAKKRETVIQAGGIRKSFAILCSGWATIQVTGPDRQTATTHVFCPGDLIGFYDLGMKFSPHDAIMQTDGSFSRFDSNDLNRLAKEHPRLLSVLISLSRVEDVVLRDRFYAATRLHAEDRLMHFLLCMRSKGMARGNMYEDHFEMPLSQKQTGDAVGLTDIYVNRLFRSLTDREEILIERPFMKINNAKKWTERVGYHDRYAEIDIAWID